MTRQSRPNDRPNQQVTADHSALKHFFVSPLHGFSVKPSYTLIGALLFTAASGITGLAVHQSTPLKATGSQPSHTAAAINPTLQNIPARAVITTLPSSLAAASSDQASGQLTSNSNVRLTINGQGIDVPINGSSTQTSTSPDGSNQTSVTVSGSQSGSGQASNTSYTSVNTSITSTNASVDQTTNQELP